MIILLMCFLKILTPHSKNQSNWEKHFFNGFQTVFNRQTLTNLILFKVRINPFQLAFISIYTRRMTMKASITSEFGYCPLLRMFLRKLNSRIKRIHEGAVRIVFHDYTSSFTELLGKNNSTNMHNRNNKLLALELFKVKNRLSPTSQCERPHYL